MICCVLALLIQDHREILDRKVEYAVTAAALEEYAKAAAQAGNTTLAIDPRVFKEVPDAARPVTHSAAGQSLKDALREVLYPRGLTVTWRDGLVIVPRARTGVPLETRTVDVGEAIERLRGREAPAVEGALERDLVAMLAKLAARKADDAVFELRPVVSRSGRQVFIQTPRIERFQSSSTIIVPTGGSVAVAGLGQSQSGGGSGASGATIAAVNVEIVDINPDHYYGYSYDETEADAASAEQPTLTMTGESLALVGKTLVGRQTKEGHRRIEALLERLRSLQ